MADELPECLRCGACCFFLPGCSVELENTDFARLQPHEQLALTEFKDGRCYMRTVDQHCLALDITGGLFVCTVYERRPQRCRDFERGGDACRYQRGEFGPD